LIQPVLSYSRLDEQGAQAKGWPQGGLLQETGKKSLAFASQEVI
jgi:hypothetical protein